MTDEQYVFDAGDVTRVSMLDEITKDLQTVVHKSSITLKVETRDRWWVRYDPNIDANQLDMWRNRCKRPGKNGDIDALKLACIVLNNTSQGLYFRSDEAVEPVEWTDEDSNVVTLRSKVFIQTMHAVDATAAIRKFFGMDSHLLAHGGKILSAAGYDEEGMEVQEEDSPLD